MNLIDYTAIFFLGIFSSINGYWNGFDSVLFLTIVLICNDIIIINCFISYKQRSAK